MGRFNLYSPPTVAFHTVPPVQFPGGGLGDGGGGCGTGGGDGGGCGLGGGAGLGGGLP
jgi:hypothetical protein